MRIAVTYDNGNIFQHFGHTEQFKIYDIENDKVISQKVINTLGSGHGALAGFLSMNNVNVLICGGIGDGAKNALKNAGIQLFGGVTGNADAAVQCYLSGNLNYNPFIQCSHHEHGHEHSCEEHSCGNHKC